MPAAGLCAPVYATPLAESVPVRGVRELANDAAMERYAAGDETAFADLYDGLGPLVMAYLSRRTRDRALVEDLIQETFLRIHLHRGRYKRDAPVLPWALTIAARLLANRLRGARRADAIFVEDDRASRGSADMASPEDLAIGMQLAQQIEQEIGCLSSKDREAFDLVKRDGLPLKIAAPRLGISPLALKMRLFRVYSRLRRTWGPSAGDGERKKR
jgi:RNA polymerase sigma-70 factor (ECF subfamily)